MEKSYEKPLRVSVWSALDLSQFFVSNRTLLVNQLAREFGGRDRAEELVQEAFLYVLTAMPELQTELDLRRYIRWKARNLALDQLKGGPAKVEARPITDDITSNRSSPEEVAIRSDEFAVIQLAISRLDARQRLALVRSAIQDHSHEQIGEELGITENAARQLVFRARTNFKKILAGEAYVAGMSMSQILGVASRKALSQASRVASIVLVFIGLGLAVSLGTDSGANSFVAGEADGLSQMNNPQAPMVVDAQPNELPTETPKESNLGFRESDEPNLDLDIVDNPERDTPADSLVADQRAAQAPPESSEAKPLPSAENSLAAFADLTFDFSLKTQARLSSSSYEDQVRRISIDLPGGNEIHMGFRNGSLSPEFVLLSYRAGDLEVIAVPTEVIASIEDSGSETPVLSIAATNFVVGDLSGFFDNVSTSSTLFYSAALVLEIANPTEAQPISSVEFVPPPSLGRSELVSP